jgi:hypothetical protein
MPQEIMQILQRKLWGEVSFTWARLLWRWLRIYWLVILTKCTRITSEIFISVAYRIYHCGIWSLKNMEQLINRERNSCLTSRRDLGWLIITQKQYNRLPIYSAPLLHLDSVRSVGFAKTTQYCWSGTSCGWQKTLFALIAPANTVNTVFGWK